MIILPKRMFYRGMISVPHNFCSEENEIACMGSLWMQIRAELLFHTPCQFTRFVVKKGCLPQGCAIKKSESFGETRRYLGMLTSFERSWESVKNKPLQRP